MFTGIVESLGTVIALTPREAGSRLQIRSTLAASLGAGASIAVNGVCLTALDPVADHFAADLAPETLARTNLGGLNPGDAVNLERPVTPATLLSGHLVQGHIDGTGEVLSMEPLGDSNWWLKVKASPELERFMVEKGSIALDGISLTIARLEPGPIVHVTIIPHTYANTTLRKAHSRARLNIEVDVIAKYVARLVGAPGGLA